MESQDENRLPVTPGQPNATSTPFLHHQTSSSNFNDLNDEELQVLTSLALNALRTRGISLNALQHAPKVPDIFDNAKYEQITCVGLQPKYNGSPDELIPTLNMIHIRRQNEVWYAATFLRQDDSNIDLVRQFSQIRQETVQSKAKDLWDSPTSMTSRHTRGTETYNSRLLALFLTNSLTADFAALLHSHIDPNYSTDGPTLLFTMCNHIHRNHLAFVESIKNKIRLATLSEYKNDVPTFLRYLQDNLRLITSTGANDSSHNDLIPHILLQLRSTTIPLFQQSVLKWQREYMESSLALTPSSLLTLADEETQILKHSGQWVETIDPSIAALQAMITSNKDGSLKFFQTLAANFTELSKRQKEINRDYRSYRDERYRDTNNNPDWLFIPPSDMSEARTYKGRQWYFCTKCGRNGRWVCTHTDETHRSPPRQEAYDDGYSRRSQRGIPYDNDARSFDYYGPRRPPYRPDYDHRPRDNRSRSPYRSRSRSPTSRHERSVSFRPPTPTPKSPTAHLSLYDSITD
jgi:hypothetical protein